MAPGERPEVPDEAWHAVTDFTEIDRTTIETLRGLDDFQRRAYLFELTDSSLHPDLDTFLREVVEGAARPPGVLLVPRLPLGELLRRPLHAVLTSLGSTGVVVRVSPDVALWRSGIEYAGAPAVLREDLRTDWQPPEEVAAIRAGELPTESASDVLVTARRWLASRIASAVDAAQAPERVLAALGVPPSEASADARKALAALAAEAGSGRADDVVPGFRADDSVLRD